MDREWLNHIKSDKTTTRCIHRTSKDLVDTILKEGLICHGGDISTTATIQPFDLEYAKGLYRIGYPERTAAIVIEFPRNRIRRICDAGITRGVGYFHPIIKDFAIRPEFIVGWIDRETDQYHPNPYENRTPPRGFEKYEPIFFE